MSYEHLLDRSELNIILTKYGIDIKDEDFVKKLIGVNAMLSQFELLEEIFGKKSIFAQKGLHELKAAHKSLLLIEEEMEAGLYPEFDLTARFQTAKSHLFNLINKTTSEREKFPDENNKLDSLLEEKLRSNLRGKLDLGQSNEGFGYGDDLFSKTKQ